jgi:hypothetical protein
LPQHRETSSSVSVRDLLAAGGAGRSTRHRAEPRTADRVKLAATAAVATGALVGGAAQLAQAAPLLPPLGGHTANSADNITLQSAGDPAETFEQAAPARVPLEKSTATPVATPVAAPANPTPFGLRNLPPEVAGPLSQAEQVIKSLQQQAAPVAAPASRGVVLQAQPWGPGQ